MSKWNMLRFPSHPRVIRGIGVLRLTALLALVLAMLVGGCALPDFGSTSAATASPTVEPTATATLAPWMGAPHALPTGWVAYHAPHFAISMPATWQVQVVRVDKFPDRPPRDDYALDSNPSTYRVVVSEWDNLSPEVVRDMFCADLADQQAVEFAGLPMHYTPADGPAAAFERIWTFVSDQGTVYELWTYDGPDASGKAPLNRAVLETFAPQYATSGC
jgi:hypothetical protein